MSSCNWLVSLSTVSPRFLPVWSVSGRPSLLRMNRIPLRGRTPYCLSVHASMVTWGCFRPLSVGDSASVDTYQAGLLNTPNCQHLILGRFHPPRISKVHLPVKNKVLWPHCPVSDWQRAALFPGQWQPDTDQKLTAVRYCAYAVVFI